MTVGLLTGLFGVGGGFAVVPALALGLRVPMRRAVATSLVVVTAISAVGFAEHLLAGSHIAWATTLPFGDLRGSRRARTGASPAVSGSTTSSCTEPPRFRATSDTAPAGTPVRSSSSRIIPPPPIIEAPIMRPAPIPISRTSAIVSARRRGAQAVTASRVAVRSRVRLADTPEERIIAATSARDSRSSPSTACCCKAARGKGGGGGVVLAVPG